MEVRVPYPRAYFWVLGLILLVIGGFWPFYWSRLAEVPWELHLHGITASCWVLMMLFQTWSIQNGHRFQHRLAGRASLALCPLITAGFVASLTGTSRLYGRGDEFYVAVGPMFCLSLAISLPGFLYLYAQALRLRRNTILHGGYMLATLLLLFQAPFSRLLVGLAPPFQIRSIDDFSNLIDAVSFSTLLAAAIGLWLWLRNRRAGRPFQDTAILLTLQAIVVKLLSDSPAADAALRAFAQVPLKFSLAAAILTGALVAGAAWVNAKPSLGAGQMAS